MTETQDSTASTQSPTDDPRPWLRHYPAPLPAELTFADFDMMALIRATVAKRPDAEVIRYFDTSLSYRDLDRMSDGFAGWLIAHGVASGDRVAIVLQNVPHTIVAVVATWKVGAVPMPANPMYRSAELARIVGDCRPAVIVCHAEKRVEVASKLAVVDHVAALVTVGADDFRGGCAQGASGTGDFLAVCEHVSGPVLRARSDIALILYTSGTTGVPKGATITHRSLVFNACTGAAWMQVDAGSRILGIAPLFHITGFVLHTAIALATGASLALNYRFQPEAVLDVIHTYRPTTTIAAITAFNALMSAVGATPDDFASFETAFTGGAPVAPALRAAVRERLGLDLHSVYGMTETCAPTHVAPLGLDAPVDAATGALSVGFPISSTEARIVDADGRPLSPGEVSEIQVRGPQVMREYWNKPDETAEVLAPDGWLRTGDIGCMDEAGWFFVVDRKKDMINASGFKVWPREVEDVLLAHPAVREAAVIGAPDAYRGETVCAYVSLTRDAGPFDPIALTAFCRERLAAYKVPRTMLTLDELPKTPTGKIQRKVLRKRFAATNAAA